MPKPEKKEINRKILGQNNLNDDELDSIDLDYFELFEVLEAKEIIQLLNSIGGKFSLSEGKAIKKLVEFINTIGDDQIDDFLDAFDNIMKGM